MRRVLAFLAAVSVLAVLGAGLASGERSQEGKLIVSLDGDLKPLFLPRDHTAPVAVHLAGRLQTEDGSPLPRVVKIELAFSGHGNLFTHGLPVCSAGQLRDTRSPEALAACGPALVGEGSLEAQALIPEQPPINVRARLLAFNGRAPNGATALLLHAYSARPPTAMVVPFVLHRRGGRFPNVLVARLSSDFGHWPRVASFQLTLSRRFFYRGVHRSFLTASCPVPPHFTAGFLSFARTSYTFAGGDRIATEIVRSCRAR